MDIKAIFAKSSRLKPQKRSKIKANAERFVWTGTILKGSQIDYIARFTLFPTERQVPNRRHSLIITTDRERDVFYNTWKYGSATMNGRPRGTAAWKGRGHDADMVTRNFTFENASIWEHSAVVIDYHVTSVILMTVRERYRGGAKAIQSTT